MTKRHKASEIAWRLRLVQDRMAQGVRLEEAVRTIGITEVTYCQWRKKFHHSEINTARRLEELEAESARLRRTVSDLTLDKLVLCEMAKDIFPSPAHRRACINVITEAFGVSERRACLLLGQHRSTQRKVQPARGRASLPLV